MKVWINGEERPDISRLASPNDILEAVNAEAARRGSILTGVQVDGAEMDASAFLGISGGLEGRFELTPLRSLLRETLDEARRYAPRLRNGLELIAAQLENGDAAQAQATLPQAVEGLDWLLSVYDRCRALMSAPLAFSEEAALREGLLRAIGSLVEHAGARRYPEMVWLLRQDLLPSIETLALRIEDLSRLRTDPQ